MYKRNVKVHDKRKAHQCAGNALTLMKVIVNTIVNRQDSKDSNTGYVFLTRCRRRFSSEDLPPNIEIIRFVRLLVYCKIFHCKFQLENVSVFKPLRSMRFETKIIYNYIYYDVIMYNRATITLYYVILLLYRASHYFLKLFYQTLNSIKI